MKKLYCLIAAIVDAVLLGIILKSYFSQKQEPKPAASSGSSAAAQSTASDTQKAETTAWEPVAASVEPDATSEAPAETTASAKPDSGGKKKNYSTDAYAQYQDMSETFLNGSSGFVWQNLTDDTVRLTDFSTVKGGWKAYIVSSPDDIEHSVTYLMNIKLSGDEKNVTVTLDWDYFYANYSGDEGHSKEPDSVYTGPWTKSGTVYAEGAGAVSLFEFDEQDGRQYGLGTVFWPDSTYGAIALVRP